MTHFNPNCNECGFGKWVIEITTDKGGRYVFMKCQICGSTVGTNWVEFRTE